MGILKIVNSSGKYHDADSTYDLIHYIADPCKTLHGRYGGLAVSSIPSLAILQMQILRQAWEKEDCVQLRHMILSFDQDELSVDNLEHINLLHQLAVHIASYYSSFYQIFYGIHENTEHLHVHFAMNMLNYQTGIQYTGKKKDLFDFLSHINRILLPFGLSADYMSNSDYVPPQKLPRSLSF